MDVPKLTITNRNGKITVKSELMTQEQLANESTLDLQLLFDDSEPNPHDDAKKPFESSTSPMLAETNSNQCQRSHLDSYQACKMVSDDHLSISLGRQEKHIVMDCSKEEQEMLMRLYLSMERTFKSMQNV